MERGSPCERASTRRNFGGPVYPWFDQEQEWKYIGELLNSRFLPETRTEILNIAQRMRSEDGIEALVLAGTELPLLLRDTVSPGIEFLDTTIIHVEAIVNELLR